MISSSTVVLFLCVCLLAKSRRDLQHIEGIKMGRGPVWMLDVLEGVISHWTAVRIKIALFLSGLSYIYHSIIKSTQVM